MECSETENNREANRLARERWASTAQEFSGRAKANKKKAAPGMLDLFETREPTE